MNKYLALIIKRKFGILPSEAVRVASLKAYCPHPVDPSDNPSGWPPDEEESVEFNYSVIKLERWKVPEVGIVGAAGQCPVCGKVFYIDTTTIK